MSKDQEKNVEEFLASLTPKKKKEIAKNLENEFKLKVIKTQTESMLNSSKQKVLKQSQEQIKGLSKVVDDYFESMEDNFVNNLITAYVHLENSFIELCSMFKHIFRAFFGFAIRYFEKKSTAYAIKKASERLNNEIENDLERIKKENAEAPRFEMNKDKDQ